jgi:hypothetical protein
MRLHVNGEGVGGALNDRVRVLDELRAAPVREVCFSPGLGVDCNVEDHLAVVPTAQVLRAATMNLLTTPSATTPRLRRVPIPKSMTCLSSPK